MSELIKADNEYKEWIAGISTDFKQPCKGSKNHQSYSLLHRI